MDKLPIPFGIEIKKQYIIGFGKKEMKHLFIGFAVTLVLTALTYAFTSNPLITIVCLVLGAIASIWLSRKDTYSQSGVEIVKSIINFHRNQQTFKYVYRHWWERKNG